MNECVAWTKETKNQAQDWGGEGTIEASMERMRMQARKKVKPISLPATGMAILSKLYSLLKKH
jgi:hypothetical protein